jgi:release factor glutamine methyltransferase
MAESETSSRVRPNDPWSVDRLVRWVTEDLKARGIESPRLEAELLLAQALGCDRLALILDRERLVEGDPLARFRALVQRRRKHEPVAYLRGEREFYGRSFRVDARVLVPRPDTETLVEVALRRTQARSMFARVLDLCTGSGNVAITLAKERPTWQVLGSDISADALLVARDNAVKLGALWNVGFVLGDLFEAVQPEAKFDLITANAPYIPSPEMEELSPDIRDHEPRLALDGGVDGLAVVRRIVQGAGARLSPGGLLALELAFDQSEAVTQLLQQHGFVQIETACDLGGRPRVVSALSA